MERLRIGVVGAGLMGRLFAKIFSELRETQLVAVADVDYARAEQAAGPAGAIAYNDYRRILDRSDVDAVAVCLPDDLHTEVSVLAAAAGKHLFVEKPLATTLSDCRQISDACERAGVKLMVGHCLRFDPRFVQGYEAIRDGHIGEILHARTWRGTSIVHGKRIGGRTSLPLFLGVHDVDILHWYLGSRVNLVHAIGVRRQLASLGVDDAVFCLLKFESGAIASVDLSWVMPQTAGQVRSNTLEKGMEITGTRGMISIAAHNVGIVVQGADAIWYPDVLYSVEVQGFTIGIYAEEARHFARCVLDNRRPAVGAAEATEAVRVALAMERSLAEGRPVAPAEIS